MMIMMMLAMVLVKRVVMTIVFTDVHCDLRLAKYYQQPHFHSFTPSTFKDRSLLYSGLIGLQLTEDFSPLQTCLNKAPWRMPMSRPGSQLCPWDPQKDDYEMDREQVILGGNGFWRSKSTSPWEHDCPCPPCFPEGGMDAQRWQMPYPKSHSRQVGVPV